MQNILINISDYFGHLVPILLSSLMRRPQGTWVFVLHDDKFSTNSTITAQQGFKFAI